MLLRDKNALIYGGGGAIGGAVAPASSLTEHRSVGRRNDGEHDGNRSVVRRLLVAHRLAGDPFDEVVERIGRFLGRLAMRTAPVSSIAAFL
jgi:hypothetical protein